MEINQIKAGTEALLFAYGEPITSAKLAEALEVEKQQVEQALAQLQQELQSGGRGIQLLQLEDAWQLATKTEYGQAVKTVLDNRRNAPLTPAALEVLAIIAYNQPVSRSFVDQVRGVDSYSTVNNMVAKGLITEAGRLDLPGRPVAFKTTDAFLRTFGISSLSELPPLHNEEAQHADEAGLYTLPQPGLLGEEELLPEEETKALRGGAYIEAEGGSAVLVGEDE